MLAENCCEVEIKAKRFQPCPLPNNFFPFSFSVLQTCRHGPMLVHVLVVFTWICESYVMLYWRTVSRSRCIQSFVLHVAHLYVLLAWPLLHVCYLFWFFELCWEVFTFVWSYIRVTPNRNWSGQNMDETGYGIDHVHSWSCWMSEYEHWTSLQYGNDVCINEYRISSRWKRILCFHGFCVCVSLKEIFGDISGAYGRFRTDLQANSYHPWKRRAFSVFSHRKCLYLLVDVYDQGSCGVLTVFISIINPPRWCKSDPVEQGAVPI